METLKNYVNWKLAHSDKVATAEGYPLVMENCKANKRMKQLQVYGDCLQSQTPSPDNPSEIQSVGDLITDTESEYYGKYKIPITVSGNNLLQTTTNLYLDKPLRKVGDYADYIDFKNQKVIRNVKEVTYNGTENWKYNDTDNVIYLSINNLASSKYCYSTHFLSQALKDTINPYFRPVSNVLRLYQQNGNILYSSADEFKIFLANQNTAGTPLIIYCLLSTPTEEDISCQLPKTLAKTTVIEVDTTLLPSNIKGKYIIK